MNKLLMRGFALLLIPCLIADPHWAFAVTAPISAYSVSPHSAAFESQAINNAIVFAPLQALVHAVKARLARNTPRAENSAQASWTEILRQKWTRLNDDLQDLYYGEEYVDHSLRINPETDVIVNVDVQATFMPKHTIEVVKWFFKKVRIVIEQGGLQVGGGHEILPNVVALNKLFSKKNRVASQDLHPYGHISLQSSYVGYENYFEQNGKFGVLVYDMVKDWSEDPADQAKYLHPHALFTVKDLKNYLQKRGYQVLWTNHAVLKLETVDHPKGHITYASSFAGQIGTKVMKPFAVLSYETVKDWSERPEDRSQYLSADAQFTVRELKAYLKKRDTKAMVLAPDNIGFSITEEAKIHQVLARLGIEYVEVKGTDPTVDSYSAFFDNMVRATELSAYLKKRGKTRIFFDGNAFDYCVGWSATGAMNSEEGNTFESIVVEDATRPVGFPLDQIQGTLLGFQQRGVRLIPKTETILRSNEGVFSLLIKLFLRKLHPQKSQEIPRPIDAETVDIKTSSIEEAYKAFETGDHKKAFYDLYAPVAPHEGSYMVAAGLEDFLADLHDRRFHPRHIQKIRESGLIKDERFLDFLQNFEFKGNIWALQEGRGASPELPLLRFEGTATEAALIQDLLKNRLGGATLVATKAARVVLAANGELLDDELLAKDPSLLKKRDVMEFGQRRAAGKTMLQLARAAIIGGAYRTSAVKAGRIFGMWISGTMAHLFITFFGPAREADAFRAYARAFPDSSVFLIDSYDSIEGARKAIEVAKEMRAGTLFKDGSSHELIGIRLDSGDLVKLSKKIRQMFDEAGFPNVQIGASNDLDEYEINRLLAAGAKIDFFGVGTNMITGGRQSSLPLELRKSDEPYEFWRIHEADGHWHDVRVPAGRVPTVPENAKAEPLLTPFWKNGERVGPDDSVVHNANQLFPPSERAKADLKGLTKQQKLLTNAAPLIVETTEGVLPSEVPADRLMALAPMVVRPHPARLRDDSEGLMVDTYHLTMAQSMFNEGLHEEQTSFDYYYRRPPYGEKPYIIVAGLKLLLDDLQRFRITRDDRRYLESLNRFTPAFLDYIEGRGFNGTIEAMPDGSIAYGNDPIMKVTATFLDAAMIETFILLNRNFRQLNATNAHIIKEGIDGALIEDGLSSAQGLAHLDASYSAHVGGADYTTSLDAAVKFDIPLAWSHTPGMRKDVEIVTGGRKSSLGGVYKLNARGKGLKLRPRIKKSGDERTKTSYPGDKVSWNVRNTAGQFVRRVIALRNETIPLQIGETAAVVQQLMMVKGRQIAELGDIHTARAAARQTTDEFALSPTPPQKAEISKGLEHLRETLIRQADIEQLTPEQRGVKIAMAQLNVKVGAFDEVVRKVTHRIHEAESDNTDLLVFQETVLTGYPAQDAWAMKRFLKKQQAALDAIVSSTAGKQVTVILGAVQKENGKLYNVAHVIQNGRIIKTIKKHHLAEAQVYNDNRRITPGPDPTNVENWIELKGRRIGIAVCEDIWQDNTNVIEALAKQGATDVVVINGSHYYGGRLQLLSKNDPTFNPERDFESLGQRYRFTDDTKQKVREELLQRKAFQHGVNIYYVNAVGGTDGIVFDGHSIAVDKHGHIQARGADFREDLITVEVGQSGNITALDDEAVRGHLPLDSIAQDYEAQVTGMTDYMSKSGISKVVEGLSGGVDSSVHGAIAVDSLARQGLPASNLIGVRMPSRLSSSGSMTDAETLAKNLGITMITVPVGTLVKATLLVLFQSLWLAHTVNQVSTMQALKIWFASALYLTTGRDRWLRSLYGKNYDLMVENLQARLRGVVLQSIANLQGGALVLNNGNRPENHRGYFTYGGDSLGGWGLGGVPKLMVYAFGLFRNREVAKGLKTGIIPPDIFTKAPSAELAPGQIDESALGPYAQQDMIDQELLRSEWDVEALIRKRPQIDPDGVLTDEQFSTMIYDVLRRYYTNEWKRQQGPKFVIRDPNEHTYAWILPINMEFLWKNSQDEILQMVKDARLMGYGSDQPEPYAVSTNDRGDISFGIKKFPDGEINILNENPDNTKGSEVTMRHSLRSADDIVRMILLIKNLRHYGADKIHLQIEAWHPENAEEHLLLRLLGTLADSVSLQGQGGDFIPQELEPIPQHIEQHQSDKDGALVILQDRLMPMAQEVAGAFNNIPIDQVHVGTVAGQANHWAVNIPPDLLSRQNAILLHSTNSSENIVQLLLTLLALGNKTGWKIDSSVVNTYEGYGRQDKVWISGQTPGALALLEIINHLATHYAVSPHYNDQIKDGKFHNYAIQPLNGFRTLAVQMFDKAMEEAIDKPIYGLHEAQKYALRDDLMKILKADALGHSVTPLLVIAPDDGAFPAVQEAAQALEDYIWQTYQIRVTVMAAFLDKTRHDAANVHMHPKLWIGKDQPFELPAGISYKNLYAFLVDDETSTGGTILSATYALVRGLGFSWRRVMAAVVQAKLSHGAQIFDTGLTASVRHISDHPSADKIKDQRMPPYRFFASNSLPRLEDEGSPEELTLAPPLVQAVSHILQEAPVHEVSGYLPPTLEQTSQHTHTAPGARLELQAG